MLHRRCLKNGFKKAPLKPHHSGASQKRLLKYLSAYNTQAAVFLINTYQKSADLNHPASMRDPLDCIASLFLELRQLMFVPKENSLCVA